MQANEEAGNWYGEDEKVVVSEATEVAMDSMNLFFQDVVMLDIDDSGVFFAKSLVEDYALQGNDLENVAIMDFMVNTYEEVKNSTTGQRRE